MCNHYQIEDTTAVLKFMGLSVSGIPATWEPDSRHAWPRYPMPVVVDHDSKRTLLNMRWGVRPWYEKGEKAKFVTNARNDKLLGSPLWREIIKTNRCLVPADGWFEWAGPKGAKFEIRLRFRDSRPLWIAGVWAKDPDGEQTGFALVTAEANQLLASVPHDRMIVILDEENAARWIGCQQIPNADLLALCRPYPDDHLVCEAIPPKTGELELGLTGL